MHILSLEYSIIRWVVYIMAITYISITNLIISSSSNSKTKKLTGRHFLIVWPDARMQLQSEI